MVLQTGGQGGGVLRPWSLPTPPLTLDGPRGTLTAQNIEDPVQLLPTPQGPVLLCPSAPGTTIPSLTWGLTSSPSHRSQDSSLSPRDPPPTTSLKSGGTRPPPPPATLSLSPQCLPRLSRSLEHKGGTLGYQVPYGAGHCTPATNRTLPLGTAAT